LTIPRKLVAVLRSTAVERSGEGVGGWSLPAFAPVAGVYVLAGLGLVLVRGRARVAFAAVLVLAAAGSFSGGPGPAVATPPQALRVTPELTGVEVVYPEDGQAVVLEVDPRGLTALPPRAGNTDAK
jgi:hypothetical protein